VGSGPGSSLASSVTRQATSCLRILVSHLENGVLSLVLPVGPSDSSVQLCGMPTQKVFIRCLPSPDAVRWPAGQGSTCPSFQGPVLVHRLPVRECAPEFIPTSQGEAKFRERL
jgi:hypothetical protein